LAIDLRLLVQEEDMETATKIKSPSEYKGLVYCPICTHHVEAVVVPVKRSAHVKPGQKCARCASSLDAGVVVRLDMAA
jgi:hypothetical protein